jgi:hypothetical protein
MTQITVAELKTVANILLSHLERHGIERIEIADDFYWDVPATKRYDQYDEPKQHDVGQLSDDVQELKRLVNGDAPAIGHGLVWLGAVMRRIGETSSC